MSNDRPIGFRPPHDIRWLDHSISMNELPRFWIPDYRRTRYLSVLTDAQLQARSEDILSNLLVLEDDRVYRPQFHVRNDGVYSPIRNLDFLRMLVETWDELRLRGNPAFQPDQRERNLQVAARLANETWCTRPDWVEGSRLSQEEYQRPRMLFKFNETKYNRDFLAGDVFVSPASMYHDASLANALADDELVKKWYRDGVVKSYSAPDYYCMCFVSTYDLRLYRDFRSSDFSCVAIKDVPEFINRLVKALGRYSRTQADNEIEQPILACPVIYYDPFSLNDMTIAAEVYYCKHFRFAYQGEFRIVARPARATVLRPFHLDIGPLSDIAELISERDFGR